MPQKRNPLSLMVGRGQEAVARSGIIGHALGGQGNRNRAIDTRQPLARQGRPNCGVAQTTRFPCRDRELADVEVVPMGMRNLQHGDRPCRLVPLREIRILSKQLCQGQCSQLESVTCIIDF